MLRTALYVVGGICLAIGAFGVAVGHHGGFFGLMIAGLVLIGALLIERWRYKELAGKRPGPEWQATGERFVDPESGKLVEVYYHPASGERRYVAV